MPFPKVFYTPQAAAAFSKVGEWTSDELPGTQSERTRAVRQLHDLGYIERVRHSKGRAVWRTVRLPRPTECLPAQSRSRPSPGSSLRPQP